MAQSTTTTDNGSGGGRRRPAPGRRRRARRGGTAPIPEIGLGDQTPSRGLIDRLAAGDEVVLRDLHQRYAGRILASVLPLLRDRRLAEDVVQETFVRAWRRAGTLDPDRPIEPWLFRIARNVAIDQMRALGCRPATVDSYDAEWMPDQSRYHDPERAANAMTVRWTVRAAIDRLPAGERDVVRLQHLDGLSHTEIAARLDISVGTVKSRSHRAHRRLAALLDALRSPSTPEAPDPLVAQPNPCRNRSAVARNLSHAGSPA